MAIYYPIGIQDFASLREGGYAYVDKTAFIARLMKTGKYYFLSRPRRFGKSLLLSTIEAFYQGRKELFEGLAISHIEYDWASHPVLHIALNAWDYNEPDSLLKKIQLRFRALGKNLRQRETRRPPLRALPLYY